MAPDVGCWFIWSGNDRRLSNARRHLFRQRRPAQLGLAGIAMQQPGIELRAETNRLTGQDDLAVVGVCRGNVTAAGMPSTSRRNVQ